MSQFFDKATRKVKTKVGKALDRLRPSSRQGDRSASPAPSQQSAHSASLGPGTGSQALESTTATTIAQLASVPMAVAMPPSHLEGPAAADQSSPPTMLAPSATPEYARAPSTPTLLATTGSAVKGLLVAARDGSDLFLPLKAALVGVIALWDICDRTAEAKTEFAKLESKLNAINAIAVAHRHEADDDVQARLEAIIEAIKSLWETVQQRQARGRVARVAQSSIDLGDIKALNAAISSLIELFQFEGGIAIQKELGLIVKRLDAVEKERRKRERVEMQGRAMKTIKSVLGDNFLSEAADDEQPDYAGCMTGTRVGVLSKFMTWIKENPVTIFWLAGMAGTGKTSIAVSLCRMLRKDPDVLFAGGYFCSRSAGSTARTDVRRILPTLAGILASQSQEFAEALEAELEEDRRVGHKPVGEQIGPLLRKPLAALASSSFPIVFVIDALDECSSERELAELLRILADFECGTKVKFILTSRPEMHIRGTPISNPDHNAILQLHAISAEEVTSDIRLYIEKRLESAGTQSSWYTDLDVELLVKLSGGLFIFASTVLLYVLDPDNDEERQNRLRKATSTVAKRSAATTAVDKVYELVLSGASQDGIIDDDELETMKDIIACILTTRVSLSVEALAELMRIKPARLRNSLRRLHSLVHIPSDDVEPGVRTLHASFGDFLFHRAPQHIRLVPTLGHDILASGCLTRMEQNDLCFNVSRSRSSFEPNSETVPDCIPSALVYACLHWAHHLDSASNRSAFDEDIGGVFRTKFLFWLEVLSVLGKVYLASGLLRIASSGVKELVVSQFLRDANAFVASSHEAISRSAPHIYLSALPFAAKDSLVYRDFEPLCTGLVSVTTVGIDRHGGGLVATLTGHEKAVNSVAYSPDSLLLASGSDDGTVRIWNTRTGEEIMSPLRSDDGEVYSVAFSPNGQYVVSGIDDGVVHLWSVSAGRPALQPLRGHSDFVSSVAFHPNGTLIASASGDCTVRLWSVETGLEVYAMNGHTDQVNAIAFSANGQLLASGSSDKTIRLWNPHTGKAVGDRLTNLEGAAINLSFSPDGKWLVAGLNDTAIARIWDLSTEQLASAVINIHFVNPSVVFSPDGLVLASADYVTIRLWDPRSGRELSRVPFSGHSDVIKSITFSPDGQFLASGSGDCTVRIWDAVGGLESAVQPLQGHNGFVTSVVVSPDGALIVSGSFDHSIRIWDANTGHEKFQPLLGHIGVVTAVDISPDCRLIASASLDHAIMLWEIHTGELVSEPLRGHEKGVLTVAFSPESRWLASGSEDGTVRVWDVATRKETAFSPLQCTTAVNSVVFSPDGQLLAATDSGGLVHFWRSGTDQPACAPFKDRSGLVNCITFSPDSQRVACDSVAKTVCVWSIADENQVLVLDGHTGEVFSVAYSPDGRHIVSASGDRTVRLWNAETGDAVVTLFGHGDTVASVAFMPDGRSILSGGTDAMIYVWDVEAALLLRSHAEQDPIAKLACSPLGKDGWIVGSSGELLLWVPEQYRGHIQLPPCSMLIGSHKVFLAVNGPENNLYWGDKWTACWRNGAHSSVPPSPF